MWWSRKEQSTDLRCGSEHERGQAVEAASQNVDMNAPNWKKQRSSRSSG